MVSYLYHKAYLNVVYRSVLILIVVDDDLVLALINSVSLNEKLS